MKERRKQSVATETMSGKMTYNLVLCRSACLTCSLLLLVLFTCCYIALLSTRVSRVGQSPKPLIFDERTSSSRHLGDYTNNSSVYCKKNATNLKQNPSNKGNFSHLIVPKKGISILNNSMTGKLWNFRNTGDLNLYLYDNLLRNNWTGNHDNLITLRNELVQYRSELDGTAKIILHQANVKAGQRLRFIFSRYTKQIPLELYKLLPKTNLMPTMERYKSCAVVGNSGLLRNSCCGDAIDKHDFVFRCNLAPLRPFSQDAGAKSSLTTMNPSILPRRYNSLKTKKDVQRYRDGLEGYTGLIWLPCFAVHTWLSTCIKAMESYNGKQVKFVCGHPSHQKDIGDFWAERGLERRMSTGMYMVMTAIQLCEEVHLYGFWPFSARYDDQRTEVAYHYFDNLQFGADNNIHDMNSEFNLLLQLHVKGVIRMHIGSCKQKCKLEHES